MLGTRATVFRNMSALVNRCIEAESSGAGKHTSIALQVRPEDTGRLR
jgi:hypothetical protein